MFTVRVAALAACRPYPTYSHPPPRVAGRAGAERHRQGQGHRSAAQRRHTPYHHAMPCQLARTAASRAPPHFRSIFISGRGRFVQIVIRRRGVVSGRGCGCVMRRPRARVRVQARVQVQAHVQARVGRHDAGWGPRGGAQAGAMRGSRNQYHDGVDGRMHVDGRQMEGIGMRGCEGMERGVCLHGREMKERGGGSDRQEDGNIRRGRRGRHAQGRTVRTWGLDLGAGRQGGLGATDKADAAAAAVDVAAAHGRRRRRVQCDWECVRERDWGERLPLEDGERGPGKGPLAAWRGRGGGRGRRRLLELLGSDGDGARARTCGEERAHEGEDDERGEEGEREVERGEPRIPGGGGAGEGRRGEVEGVGGGREDEHGGGLGQGDVATGVLERCDDGSYMCLGGCLPMLIA
ncbi:hypothetical protein GGX14DRAFT_632420 [Mycena pura]|uniref:Uncharacterized protein n=1 Tax=Mycena pura TaxID=153505 RepID=A0AAD6YGV9_9AGAR|nr:hypothetical protein GGX14DRAFT_632420 [Mycena pura]